MDKYRTKHCWQNYVDYHKCVNARGEEFAPCRQVHFEASLCDSEAKTFSVVLDRIQVALSEWLDQSLGRSAWYVCLNIPANCRYDSLQMADADIHNCRKRNFPYKTRRIGV